MSESKTANNKQLSESQEETKQLHRDESRGDSLIDELENNINNMFGLLDKKGNNYSEEGDESSQEQQRQNSKSGGSKAQQQQKQQSLTGYELMEQKLELELAESQLASKMQRRSNYKANIAAINERKQRQWLINHGKGHLLDFQDDQIRKLKDCFGSLDDDGSGSIGIEELQEPLIGLGFADKVEEVEEMVALVDEDGSGMIEFNEFLDIINSDSNVKTQAITKFFKDLTSGKYGNQDISFALFVQQMRRKHLLDAIKSDDNDARVTGRRIMKNVEELIEKEKLAALEAGEEDSDN